MEELTRSLIKNGEDAEIVDIAAKERGKIEIPLSEVSVPSIFTKSDVSLGIMHKLKRVVYSIALARKLKKILKSTDEKVVLHFHNQYNLFFFLKLTNKKLLSKALIAYTVHSYVWHGEWSEIEGTVKKKYFQEVVCLKNADCIFVLNEKTKSNISDNIEGVPAEKVLLINNGVNSDTYRRFSAEEKESTKEKLGVKNKIVFIQVGSVCDRKNQLESVRLLLPLMKQKDNVVFCYMGGIISQEYQDQIKKFAEENSVSDRVLYCGEICPGMTLNEYYNVAEAMIFPSKAEGFSLVVIEAMSAGVPVVINKDLIFKLSDDCLRYDDDDSFMKIINENILDKNCRDSLSDRVRDAATGEYSWDAIAKDYVNNFEKGFNNK